MYYQSHPRLVYRWDEVQCFVLQFGVQRKPLYRSSWGHLCWIPEQFSSGIQRYRPSTYLWDTSCWTPNCSRPLFWKIRIFLYLVPQGNDRKIFDIQQCCRICIAGEYDTALRCMTRRQQDDWLRTRWLRSTIRIPYGIPTHHLAIVEINHPRMT